MSYRELIKMYKNGKLDDEKNEIVKNDIERQEAISEYLFEEGKIPEIEDINTNRYENESYKNESYKSEQNNTPDDEAAKFSKMIKKYIRNAFIKMGITTGAIVLLIVIFVIFAIPQIIDSFYYNPSEKVFGEESFQSNRMSLDIATYSELFLPGHYRDKVRVNGNGNGNYDVNIFQTSSATGIFNNVGGKIEKDKLTLFDVNLLKYPASNAFAPGYPDLKIHVESANFKENSSDFKKRLKDFDENDYYLAYVTLGDIKNYTQFVEWSKKAELRPDWCAICQKKDDVYYFDQYSFGFNYSNSCNILTYDKNTYPYLSYFDTSSAKESSNDLKKYEKIVNTHVVSLLRYMAKQTSFNKMIGSDFTEDNYLEIADNVEKNGLNIYGFVITAQKSTLLKMSEDKGISYISVVPMK